MQRLRPAPSDVVGHNTILPSTRDIPASHERPAAADSSGPSLMPGIKVATFFPPASASSENRRARIAVLERELETLRRDQADDDDGAWLQQLVAAVGTAVCFSAADLQQHAQVEPALRALLAGLDARRIGKIANPSQSPPTHVGS